MGKGSDNTPEKKPAKWSPFRLFEWIDSHPSETRRRITQNLISGLLLATITATAGLVWTNKSTMEKIPKWSLDLLQSPIQVQLWFLLLVLLILFGMAWFIYWIRGKNKKIAKLEATIKTLTPRTTDEILNDIYQRQRKSIRLVTKSWFYPKIDSTDDRHGRDAHVKIEAANDSERPIILTELVAEYDDGSWRSIYVYRQNDENKTQGVQLNDQEKYTVDEDTFDFMVIDKESGEGATDFWFVDSLGNKYPVTDIKKNLELYFNNLKQAPIQPATQTQYTLTGEFKGKQGHKCSRCGFVYLVQVPNLVGTEGDGKSQVTCPQCGQLDK
jgi:hypothetical protein